MYSALNNLWPANAMGVFLSFALKKKKKAILEHVSNERLHFLIASVLDLKPKDLL